MFDNTAPGSNWSYDKIFKDKIYTSSRYLDNFNNSSVGDVIDIKVGYIVADNVLIIIYTDK